MRRYLFKTIGNYIHKNHNMVLLYVDLVSYFTCILLGLYPANLLVVKEAGSTVGIWNAIHQEFKNMGREEYFFKPYVKICFYSGIFGGGSKAMVNGILDDECKKSGMRPKEFKDSEAKSIIQSKATEIAQIMNNLDRIQEFRSMSKFIEKIHDGELFMDPPGHDYIIYNTEFRNSFSMYLQSFEFAILAQSTLNTFNKFKDSELLYHFHDGNVIAVKESEVKPFLEELYNQVENTGKALRLN